MPNFQNGKIYMIRSSSRQDLIYIGSTTQTLAQRMAKHRAPSNACSSREIISIGDAYIELIENFPCNSKDELNARENRHLRSLQNVVNRYSAHDDCTHGKQQNQCVQCYGSCICVHDRQRSICIQCHGTSICDHNKRRNACIECSPIQCEACNKTCSKGNYKNHIKSAKHIENITE